MSELRKTSPNDLYFATLTIVGWIDLFTRECYKEIIIDNLKYCQQNENLEIYAYVIMSNHLHLVCKREDEDLNELIGRFKSYTSKLFLKEIKNNYTESRKDWLLKLFHDYALKNKQYSEFHLWQRSNFPVPLYSNQVIEQKINYIHNNPVRAGLVLEPENYKYSSACPESPLEVVQF